MDSSIYLSICLALLAKGAMGLADAAVVRGLFLDGAAAAYPDLGALHGDDLLPGLVDAGVDAAGDAEAAHVDGHPNGRPGRQSQGLELRRRQHPEAFEAAVVVCPLLYLSLGVVVVIVVILTTATFGITTTAAAASSASAATVAPLLMLRELRLRAQHE